MFKRVYLKDDFLESRLIRRRLIVSAGIVLVLIGIVVARLYVLQIVDYEHFSTLSDSNRIRIRALPPTRGLIYDRNGVVMANNLPAYRLEIVREQVEDMDETLSQLKHYIDYTDQDLERFQLLSRRRRPFESIPLRLNLNDEEVARLAVNLHKFSGVEINARLTRNYPKGSHAVHALGYVGRIDVDDLSRVDEISYAGTSHIGKLGLEKYYETELHGTVGVQQVEVNAKGRTLRVLNETPPIPGKNLHLTIDSKLQKVAEQSFGEESGALVAINPNNGEILALVSMPIFDPNLFVNGVSYENYNKLRDSPSRPLFNRALSGQYPPGSTAKPFFALAALEANVIDKDKTVTCKGFYRLPNEERKFRDWKKEGHGEMNMKNAITQSCDVYFYDLSYRLGIDKMSALLEQFGFGQKTNIDSTGERAGILPSREWKRKTEGIMWFPGETLNTGIGQGAFLVTPLQLANAIAALSLKGKRYRPRLVRSIKDNNTEELLETRVEIAGQYQLGKESNWKHIQNSMINVVHGLRGTAARINRGLKYKMAGKTGTSQVFGIAQDEEYDAETIAKNLRDHGLFISYAPAGKPRIAVAVIVENGGHGSSSAAPIARKVMDAYLMGKS
ncbi:MAG: penicillin-binding protein 2 [Gammaproteobacteria bacterium]|nr:MAG: penicillin-binding protein 2 [Gammaproteobacteria bacterium]